MIYVFDDCELDLEKVELRVGGLRRAVEPQVFDVLSVLVRHRDRLVPKEQLLDEVWQHRFVADSAISSRIKSARQAIGDDGRTQRLIRTVHDRGYQFVGDVREVGAAPRRGPVPVPVPATPTVGRETEVEAVLALLDRSRLLTLVGPGGVGKTRLATEVARRRCADGQQEPCFVDLTLIRAADDIHGAVLRGLGFHDGEEADALVLEEAVRGRSLLLVLDNFEHVLDGAGLASRLVASSPGVQVLVTSRAPLRVAGEHVHDVAPLPIDPAVALFAQAAAASDPSFALADAQLDDVRAICRSLDGLPLAIELAAGQVRTLPPSLLRSRLGARLGSADLAPRDAPLRHRTMRETVDWSLQLLDGRSRRLFARLGVFNGPVPLDAITGVGDDAAGDVVDPLARLVDHSLVRRVAGVAGEPRFVLLEVLRERARELLAEGGERAEIERRHAGFVAGFVEDIEEHRWTDGAETWIDRIVELLGEIRAAHDWARAHGEAELAARIAGCLGNYWHSQGNPAGYRSWARDALAARDDLEPLVRGRLLISAGFVAWPDSAVEARDLWTTALETFRAIGHERYVARCLGLLAGTYIGDDTNAEHAGRLCDESVERARRTGEVKLLGSSLNIRGEIARVQGDDDAARGYYEEALGCIDEVGHRAILLGNLAFLADHRGDLHEARRLGCEALRLAWSAGRWKTVSTMLWLLGGPELGLGRPERGAMLLGAGDEGLRALGANLHPGDRSEHRRIADALTAALGEQRARHLGEEGARLPLAAAVALALAE
jgi:predicted ATPase